MKLWLLSQDDNTGYDTYDSCVVAAETEAEAKHISPSANKFSDGFSDWLRTWAYSPESVLAVCIGEATEGTQSGVVISSFNAG